MRFIDIEDNTNTQADNHDDRLNPKDLPSGIDLFEEEQNISGIEEDGSPPESGIDNEGDYEESEPVGDSGDSGSDDSDEIKIEHPVQPGPSVYYLEEQEISAYCITQQGESHKRKDVLCQDWSGIRVIEDRGIVISAIADGVGSCELSDLGAECAVNRSLSVCEAALRNTGLEINPKEMGTLLRRAMNEAYDAVEALADENDVLLYSFQSTLTIAIYDGSDLYMGHAGDDGIVVITDDGGCHLATVRHKGDEASSVFPLQSKATWQFGMAPHIAAYFMCTDGVLDGFVRDETEMNRVYYPFIEKEISEPLNDFCAVGQKCNERNDILLSPWYREKVGDDLTFVSVVNQKKMAEIRSKIIFDRHAWKTDTEKYRQERIEKVRELEKQQERILKKKIEDQMTAAGGKLTRSRTYVEGYTKQANNTRPRTAVPTKLPDSSKYGEGYIKQPSEPMPGGMRNSSGYSRPRGDQNMQTPMRQPDRQGMPAHQGQQIPGNQSTYPNQPTYPRPQGWQDQHNDIDSMLKFTDRQLAKEVTSIYNATKQVRDNLKKGYAEKPPDPEDGTENKRPNT